MQALLFPTLLVAALSAAWPAAQAKDVEVDKAQAGRATIAVDPANNASFALGSGTPDCWTRYAVFMTQDNGSTWQRNCTMWGTADDEGPIEEPTVAITQGQVIAVQPLYWDSDGGSLRAARSINAGTDWDGWYSVDYSRYYHGTILNPQAEVDNAPASPYRNTVYVSYTDNGWDDVSFSQVRVARSADAGKSWKAVRATPEAQGDERLDFGDLAIGRRGELFLSYMSCTGPQAECRGQAAQLRLVKSTDGGQTWGTPTAMASIQLPQGESIINTYLENDYGALPGTKAAVSYTPVIAVDATEGQWQNRLYAVMTTYADKHLQVLLTTSNDQGATWSAPKPVATGPRAADQFMPWVSVNAEGVVAVTWQDQRRHPQQADYQPMVAYSTDGGATFSAPAALQADAADPVKFKDLRGSASHVWAGKRLKTAHIGANAAGAPSLRLSTSKP